MRKKGGTVNGSDAMRIAVLTVLAVVAGYLVGEAVLRRLRETESETAKSHTVRGFTSSKQRATWLFALATGGVALAALIYQTDALARRLEEQDRGVAERLSGAKAEGYNEGAQFAASLCDDHRVSGTSEKCVVLLQEYIDRVNEGDYRSRLQEEQDNRVPPEFEFEGR